MYDLCIIGAGPGGYAAAIRARELGLKTLLVEKNLLGGTCLNRGCIPTKVLLNSAKFLSKVRGSSNLGINLKEASLDFIKVRARAEEVVSGLRNAMAGYLKSKAVEYIEGKAKIVSANEIAIDERDKKKVKTHKKINSRFIIISSGSSPLELPNLKFNARRIISSDELLKLDYLPKKLLIVGGGAIGCEFASIYNEFGTLVTIVELKERILPNEDEETSKRLELSLKKKGIKIFTSSKVEDIDISSFEIILVSVGRRPFTQDLGLDKLGLEIEKDKIPVNSQLQTRVPNLYALGDCIGGYLLAHVATYEGLLAAENIAGAKKEVEYLGVPNCIFTQPQMATVGINTQSAREKGLQIKVNKFSFLSSPAARILGETEGFIKVIVEAQTKKVLGASILGPEACELINIFALAVRERMKLSQLKATIFAHPTLSESIASI